MTPAKLLALMAARLDELELRALPIDKVAWMYVNKNRDPGGKDENGVIRPPAPAIELKEMRTLYRPRKNLAAKLDSGYMPSLHGAIADKSAWGAWVDGSRARGGK